MNMPYLSSHSPSHLSDILGSGWVSDGSHSVPQVVATEQLVGNVQATQMASLLAGFQCNFQDHPMGSGGLGWV